MPPRNFQEDFISEALVQLELLLVKNIIKIYIQLDIIQESKFIILEYGYSLIAAFGLLNSAFYLPVFYIYCVLRGIII